MKKLTLLLLPLLGLYFTLTSATCIRPASEPSSPGSFITAAAHAAPSRARHLNFFQRLALKLLLKKEKLMEEVKANKLAHTSLTLGIVAAGTLVLGLFIPYLIFLCIPGGIAAMITGGAALRKNTSLPGKARTGKGLGLGVLITFGVILIVGALLLASLGGIE